MNKKNIVIIISTVCITMASTLSLPIPSTKNKSFNIKKETNIAKKSIHYSISQGDFNARLEVEELINKNKLNIISYFISKKNISCTKMKILDSNDYPILNILITKWLSKQPKTLFSSKPKKHHDMIINTQK